MARVRWMVAVGMMVPMLGPGWGWAAASESKPADLRAPDTQDQIETFNLASYADDGSKQWEVVGQSANVADAVIDMKDVAATSYGPQANVTLTAKEGTFNRDQQDVQLRHDVKAVTTEGTTLTTETLAWNANRQIASTPDWTMVQRANMTVQGQGAIGQPQLKKVRFQEQVRVDLQPSTVITCRGPLEVDYDRNRARFWRQVHVTDPRGDIWADRMDVQVHPTTHKLMDVQCWGHVKLQQNGQTARAHRAVYHQTTGKMVLIGHPRIAFHSDQTMEIPVLAKPTESKSAPRQDAQRPAP